MKKTVLFFLMAFFSAKLFAGGVLPQDDLNRRIALDFSKTEAEIRAYIQKYIPNVTDEQMLQWERSGALECRIINGEKRYFRNAAPNLFRIDENCRKIKEAKDGIQHKAYVDDNAVNIPIVMKEASLSSNGLADPKRVRITYTLTVNADAVPAGKVVRCWLPFPRTDFERQKDVKLLKTSERKYILSGNRSDHSTLYMERKAVKGKPTVFKEVFEYTTMGAWKNVQVCNIKPYDTTSSEYKEYTAERFPHMVFSSRLRKLADSLTVGLYNPYDKARAIFTWIDEKFPWASAREYSTIDNIPEYVLDNGHGDCGQVTLLFLTLCRIVGIPAHFESGFHVHPNDDNLHDWGEIYFEGIGWVPVDVSFGRVPNAKDDAMRYFYLGGMDSWRFVVNNDWGKPLIPEKKYPRSETVDFQRGEVEWEGGNLYFNNWEYNYKIENISLTPTLPGREGRTN